MSVKSWKKRSGGWESGRRTDSKRKRSDKTGGGELALIWFLNESMTPRIFILNIGKTLLNLISLLSLSPQYRSSLVSVLIHLLIYSSFSFFIHMLSSVYLIFCLPKSLHLPPTLFWPPVTPMLSLSNLLLPILNAWFLSLPCSPSQECVTVI